MCIFAHLQISHPLMMSYSVSQHFRHLIQYNGCDLKLKMVCQYLTGSISWFFIRTGMHSKWISTKKIGFLIYFSSLSCLLGSNFILGFTQDKDKPEKCYKWAFLATFSGLCGMGPWAWMPYRSPGNKLGLPFEIFVYHKVQKRWKKLTLTMPSD
jgi:hypothetical protein